jgi:energy-coupling factor transporter ATPase
MDIIKATDVKYSYVGEEKITFALTGVTMNVAKGEFVAIIGHNGSGKSTLAKHINALFLPEDGKVVVDGMDTADEKNVWEIRRRAGMVFQNPDNQMVATIVEEDVAFGPENIGVPPEEIRQRVDEALEIVDMSEYKTRAPHMLSGGQKQRVAIAGVLAMKPEIIVFDEPTAMLDPEGRTEVMDTAKMLNKQGKTIVFITHYMEEALEADRVFVMTAGRILASGSPCEIFDDQKVLKEAGLAPPPHIELYHRLKNDGYDVGRCPMSIDELVDSLKISRKPKAVKAAVAAKKPKISDMSIEVSELNYTYMPSSPFEAVALHDVSVKIDVGEFIGIIGHTGSGKTTLIGLIAGLLKPTSGEVLVYGKNINEKKYDRKELRRHVGVVFQYPEHQLFEETVYKDIAFGPKKAGIDEKETEKRVRHAMELMEIDYEELKDLSPFELSGGQKRRVAIAGVIALEPEVLILDEPVAGLDPLGRRHLMKLINHLNSEGKTIIMITHSMDDLAENAHRVLVMKEAKIMMDDLPSKVFSRADELTRSGLDVPCVKKIVGRLKQDGFEIDERVIELSELEAALKYMMDKPTPQKKAGESLD